MRNSSTILKVKLLLALFVVLAACIVLLVACAANSAPSAVPRATGEKASPSVRATTSRPTSKPVFVPTSVPLAKTPIPTPPSPTVILPTITPVAKTPLPTASIPTLTWTLVVTDAVPQNAIAFSSNMRTGSTNFDIWLVYPDWSGLSLLPGGLCDRTDNSSSETQPAWSPDGRKLAFISSDGSSDDLPLLCVLDFDLGTTVAISGAWSISPSPWAPNSTQVAYSGSEGLWIADLDHPDQPRLLYQVPGGPGWWTTDGRVIALGRGKWKSEDPTGLEIIGLDGALFEPRDQDLPLGSGAGIVKDIAWSPDGRYVLVSYRASRWGGYLALFEVDAEQQAFFLKETISDFENYDVGLDYCQSSWSPDGTRIVFVSGGPYFTSECAGRLYVADADLSNVTLLVEGDGLFGSPSWSPDGRSILFVKAREVHDPGEESPSPGPPDSIWIVSSDGTGLRRLVGGDKFVYNRPIWQPSSQEP